MDVIRLANVKDAKEILDIYIPYIEKTTITFETQFPSVDEFSKRIETILKKYPYYVYVRDDKIIGYAYASTFKARAAYQWACELSVYVKWEMQHLGIGSKLYDQLENSLRNCGYLNTYACITYPKPQSISFH